MKKYYSLLQGENEASINIYGDITSWEWLESDVSSYTLSKELEGLDVNTIHVYINSYGGEVAEGLAIYNALKRHKAKIKTYCDGFAASVASVIFMAGDERIMSNASLLFIHNAWTHTAGNANELRKQAEDLETITQASINTYMEHINITEEELKEMLDAETWIAPQNALEMGFATAIINDNSSQNPNQSVKKKLFEMILLSRKKQQQEPKQTEPEQPKEPQQSKELEQAPTSEPETPKEPQENKPMKFLQALLR